MVGVVSTFMSIIISISLVYILMSIDIVNNHLLMVVVGLLLYDFIKDIVKWFRSKSS
jgi:hypothetical protein